MTDNAIVLAPQTKFIAPVVNVREALQAYQDMKDFVAGVLHENVDYGKIPGAGDKPTLLKPGAEKLSRFFGLAIHLEAMTVTEDWTGAEHGEPFFFYRYKAKAMRGDMLVAEGVGSCSSWEKKYRYRYGERVCPKCGKATIIAGKKEYGGGWLCFAKKGGCGAKFDDKSPEIIGQQVGQVVNPDPADVVNTIDKMAQKRAIIAAVLLGCNASEYFTQDIEDYAVGEWREEPPVTTTVIHSPGTSSVAQTLSYPEPHGDAAMDDVDSNLQHEMDTDHTQAETAYTYTGKPNAKMGKHSYPMQWVKLLATHKATNEHERDGILQQLRPSFDLRPEDVVTLINEHMAQKEAA